MGQSSSAGVPLRAYRFLKFLQCLQTFTKVINPQSKSMPKQTAHPILCGVQSPLNRSLTFSLETALVLTSGQVPFHSVPATERGSSISTAEGASVVGGVDYRCTEGGVELLPTS